MADVENQLDSSFPVKRKPDLCCQDQDNVANKAQKLNPLSCVADSECRDGEVSVSGVENLNSYTIGTKEASVSLEKAACSVSEKEDGDFDAEEKQESGDGEEEEEDDDDEIEARIDRKGKGISREDKGKGKAIELDESDDSDEYYESDLSDDPLAEVDLDNILPSRTRRRSIQPGVYMSNDRGGGTNEDDDDDDSSDNSDA